MTGRHGDSARWQDTDDLLGRITSILDAARVQAARAVNQATVAAYWHIGREMVEALQQGESLLASNSGCVRR